MRHEGRIWAGGIEKGFTFVEASDPDLNDQIDAAYRTKYRRNADSYVPLTNVRPRLCRSSSFRSLS